ncbi:MAG: hypothetical protein AB7D06_03635 [Pedobacter sp.]|jgi:hypothetical protein
MRRVVEITALTLKRLQNYRQVVDNELHHAHKRQWMEMTLESMQACEVAVKKSDRIGAAVGYASVQFRIQNGLTHDRSLYGEPLLVNGLVGLLRELCIPVVMIDTPERTPESMLSN